MQKKRLFLPPLIAIAFVITGCATAFPPAGTLTEAKLRETSGMASSLVDDQRLWLINDSDKIATLYATDTAGQSQARVQLPSLINRDWEDLSSFRWRKRNWLLIADIGDNNAMYEHLTLHFVEEPKLPAQAKTIRLQPNFSIQFSYSDGARDAEAIAFDPITEQLLILSKRERPNALYALSLDQLFEHPDKHHQAERISTLAWDGEAPSISTLFVDPRQALTHGLSTAMDISSDGLQAVIVGYHHAVLLNRSKNQPWSEAERTRLPPHELMQAEAVCFNHNATKVFVTSEGKHAPLISQPIP